MSPLDKIIEEFDQKSQRSLFVSPDVWSLFFDKEPEGILPLGLYECDKGTIGVTCDFMMDDGCWEWKTLEDMMFGSFGLLSMMGRKPRPSDNPKF